MPLAGLSPQELSVLFLVLRKINQGFRKISVRGIAHDAKCGMQLAQNMLNMISITLHSLHISLTKENDELWRVI